MPPEARADGIDALDFDDNRQHQPSARPSSADDYPSRLSEDDEDVGLLQEVAEDIVNRDRATLKREMSRYVSFASAILSSLCAGSITSFSLYGPLFLKNLRYNQYEINAISVAGELAMYLPVPVFGYLVDRYSPRPVALFSSIMFAFGYFLAAFTYRSGPREQDGWPFGVMVLAFCAIGMGTASMYLAAVTACAKNFGSSKYKGIALSLPIASFGLSGMWQSQVGSHFLSEQKSDGSNEVNVFHYFLFLGCTLLAVGLIGSLAQRVVNEEELIDDAVDELQRSGILEESPFFSHSNGQHGSNRLDGYGTILDDEDGHERNSAMLGSWSKPGDDEGEEEQRKKTWLLNGETRRFLADHTMWFLALGFFLVTGPVETFINNCGTMLTTLYPPPATVPANAAADQVSILAVTSTLARLAAGFVSDLISPSSAQSNPQYKALTPGASQHLDPFQDPLYAAKSRRCSISRLTLLIVTAGLLTVGCILLVSPLPIEHPRSFAAVTAVLGTVNGAAFALVPLLISAVWGVQNFGTNWGIVAMMPALGATLWSALYSVGYQAHAGENDMCYGSECFRGVALGMMLAGIGAMASWTWIGWGRDGWWQRGVVV